MGLRGDSSVSAERVWWMRRVPKCVCIGTSGAWDDCQSSECDLWQQLISNSRRTVIFIDAPLSSSRCLQQWNEHVLRRAETEPFHTRVVIVIMRANNLFAPAMSPDHSLRLSPTLSSDDMSRYCQLLEHCLYVQDQLTIPDEAIERASQRSVVLKDAQHVAEKNSNPIHRHVAVFLMAATQLRHETPRDCAKRVRKSLEALKRPDVLKVARAMAFASAFADNYSLTFFPVSTVYVNLGEEAYAVFKQMLLFDRKTDTVSMHPMWGRSFITVIPNLKRIFHLEHNVL